MSETPILDMAGVAELLGVNTRTVAAYRAGRHRETFPTPAGYMGRSPYWNREDIEAWQNRKNHGKKSD